MTYDRLCYFVFTTALLLVGLKFEEAKLVREFGQQYIEYQKRTPMFWPIGINVGKKKDNATQKKKE